jgi:hypothetical protein
MSWIESSIWNLTERVEDFRAGAVWSLRPRHCVHRHRVIGHRATEVIFSLTLQFCLAAGLDIGNKILVHGQFSTDKSRKR